MFRMFSPEGSSRPKRMSEKRHLF